VQRGCRRVMVRCFRVVLGCFQMHFLRHGFGPLWGVLLLTRNSSLRNVTATITRAGNSPKTDME
jgi:hypothetical protein